MKIRTVWQHEPTYNEVMPWLVAAVDEYTIEEHDGLPDFYQRELVKPDRRELIIEVPDGVVQNLFVPPVVKGTTKE